MKLDTENRQDIKFFHLKYFTKMILRIFLLSFGLFKIKSYLSVLKLIKRKLCLYKKKMFKANL